MFVYRTVGMKSGGRGFSRGMSCRGSPLMSQMIQNRLGSSVSMGLILQATGLYFLLAKIASGVRVLRLNMGIGGSAESLCRVLH